MLIVSGGDLVGKTTFVRRAYKELDELGFKHMPFHLTKPPRNFDYYSGYLNLINPESIWDRFALDAIAYRSCDDYPSTLTPMKWSLVEAACRRMGGFQVVMYCSQNDIDKRYEEERHGQTHMYPLEHARLVNSRFADLACAGSCHMRGDTYKYTIDATIFTSGDQRDIDRAIMRVIHEYATHYTTWKETHDELDRPAHAREVNG